MLTVTHLCYFAKVVTIGILLGAKHGAGRADIGKGEAQYAS
jgi:hypothetical protein